MKPRIGVYLSQDLAARLAVAVAVQRPGISRSALVEAALDRYLGPDENAEQSVNGRLGAMSQQLEQLASDLRIVSETVALQARFHLATTPRMSAPALRTACMRGADRFDEFVVQIQNRIQQGTSLMRETMDRLDGARHCDVDGHRSREASPGDLAVDELDRDPARSVDGMAACAVHDCGSHNVVPEPRENLSAKSGASWTVTHQCAPAAAPPTQVCRFAASKPSDQHEAPSWHLILRVFLPFVGAYYLSFLFRTISATIADPLASEFGLGAGNLGFLASTYFLAFAAAQIPVGIMLDRYGPRLILSATLLIAAAGAALFATAGNFWMLMAGRALIGLGVAAALTGGLKALVLWFPKERISLLNGLMMMMGAFGVVTATLPAEFMLASMGWRGLFEALAVCSLVCALMIFLVVPRSAPGRLVGNPHSNVGLTTIYGDQRFWRLAPLSATCIGTAWSLQGLWAVPWFSDVEGLDRQTILQNLFVMAIALCIGALVFGMTADRMRQRGVGPRTLLGYVAAVFIAAQLVLILRLPLPSLVPWVIVAAVGAATVLSYAVLGEYFPKEIAGRANAALNAFHIGGAFAFQALTGSVLQLWVPIDGHYPVLAYQIALSMNVGLQIAAGVWFAFDPRTIPFGKKRLPAHVWPKMSHS